MTVPPDLDRDGDVDANDLIAFESCMSRAGVPYTGDCGKADFDKDGDVDVDDFGRFQRCYSGENNPADLHCAD
jgi:hypothetical protein